GNEAATGFHGPVRAYGDIVVGDKVVQHADARRAPPIGQLPIAPDPFAGRDGELAALDDAVRLAQGRRSATLVEVHGMAGAGKTALAVHWAYQTTGSYPDGQIFLDLYDASERAAVSAEKALFWLLKALGMAPTDIPGEQAPRAALLRSLLVDRRI